MFGSLAPNNSNTQAHNPNKDYELPHSPTDGISCLKFSPINIGNFIIAGSWDKNIRCWELNVNKQVNATPTVLGALPKTMISYESQILCCDWAANGQNVFIGGCDNKAKMWSLANNQLVQVAQHDAPIKELCWIEDKQILVTGSWDKTIKYWDLRSPTPALSVELSDKVFAMDCISPLLAVATGDRQVHVFDINNPSKPYLKRESPLKLQTRSLACFPDKTGFAIGSIEGRVGIEYFDGPSEAKFTFKCHREGDVTAYAVNCITFATPYGTFATAGSDGITNFWDKDNRNRLKQFTKCPAPISAATFNQDASLYAYATSYEWNKGYSYYDPNASNYIFIHPVSSEEIKKNVKSNSKRNR